MYGCHLLPDKTLKPMANVYYIRPSATKNPSKLPITIFFSCMDRGKTALAHYFIPYMT